jgi:hypothetical protein
LRERFDTRFLRDVIVWLVVQTVRNDVGKGPSRERRYQRPAYPSQRVYRQR